MLKSNYPDTHCIINTIQTAGDSRGRPTTRGAHTSQLISRHHPKAQPMNSPTATEQNIGCPRRGHKNCEEWIYNCKSILWPWEMQLLADQDWYGVAPCAVLFLLTRALIPLTISCLLFIGRCSVLYCLVACSSTSNTHHDMHAHIHEPPPIITPSKFPTRTSRRRNDSRERKRSKYTARGNTPLSATPPPEPEENVKRWGARGARGRIKRWWHVSRHIHEPLSRAAKSSCAICVLCALHSYMIL